ncbi:MAG: hypothetical protein FWB78_01025 [Treponema sp.]|nr:hypothetical protein [Treponema sp.]
MADTAAPSYVEVLSKALVERKDWLEKTEIPRLKDELRLFQISFSVLYGIYIKKKLINEDPYKQESKITELEVPESGPLNEARRRDQISIRLASFDSQLDFLVNFYQFSVDYLNLGRIRKIAGLIRYIDWVSLTPDSKSPNTKAVAEITLNSKAGDQLTLSVIGEGLTRLSKCTVSVMGILRELTIYHKENYKLAVRGAIRGTTAADATVPNIKKKISASAPGAPLYQEFIEEVIHEDYSAEGRPLKEAVLKSLRVTAASAKSAKPKVDYKGILLDGIRALGLSTSVLSEVAQKIDENEMTLTNEKKSIWTKIKQLIRSMMNSEPEAVIYELVFVDPVKATQTKEYLNLGQFRAELDRKIKIFSGIGGQGPLITKLRAMPEDQILGYLERAIRDIQNFYRILTALDDYFKATAKESRDRIKGIKPELSSIKNCIVKANQIQHEYNAAKEEAEQMKRLGNSAETRAADV